MKNELKVAKWLLAVFIVVLILGIGTAAWYLWQAKSKVDTQVNTVETESVSNTDWKTYQNSEYGFSFKYPSNYLVVANSLKNDQDKGIGGENLIYKVEFRDEAQNKKMICVNNEYQNWKQNGVIEGVTRQECEPILKDLTEAEKTELVGPVVARNVFVRVSKANGENLSSWLVKEYKDPNTELANYTPGEKITMAGQNGFISSIGCCGSSDVSYVVKKGDYIFALGTNYQDLAILSDLAKNFELD